MAEDLWEYDEPNKADAEESEGDTCVWLGREHGWIAVRCSAFIARQAISCCTRRLV